jgi:phage terminase large subunit-like protein
VTTAAPSRPKRPVGDDEATAYARAVVAEQYVAGKWVRLACERHLRDLETGHERGLRWDPKAAQRAVSFFRLLPLPSGNGAGTPFVLQPWQAFIVGSLFGWLGRDGRRRYHYALVEVARANGKSPLAGGIGLYGLVGDKEQGAEIYSAATTRDQAKIVFNDAVRMAEAAPYIWRQLIKTVNNLAHPGQSAFFRPLAAEASKMDGLRVHMALVDELHEHPNGEVMAKLRTGMKSRQPLLFAITTAGYDRHSVCYEEHDIACKVLEGIVENDAYFAYIAQIDDGDDWTAEDCWAKANPNLGVTVRLETLREECELAKQVPGQQNSFKRLRLNVWTEQATRWLDMALWDENAGELSYGDLRESLKGRECYAGVDLSSTQDLSAVELVFPDDDGGASILTFAFAPEDNLRARAERDRVPYPVWAEQGWIEPTEGNVIDHQRIRARLGELAEDYVIREVAYDPWSAMQFALGLQEDGFTVVPIRQGFVSLSEPTKALERLLLARKVRHGGHPVLRWAASNVAIGQDAAGNIKPDKARSTERIDPIAALVTAMARTILSTDDETSAYESERLTFL